MEIEVVLGCILCFDFVYSVQHHLQKLFNCLSSCVFEMLLFFCLPSMCLQQEEEQEPEQMTEMSIEPPFPTDPDAVHNVLQ